MAQNKQMVFFHKILGMYRLTTKHYKLRKEIQSLSLTLNKRYPSNLS